MCVMFNDSDDFNIASILERQLIYAFNFDEDEEDSTFGVYTIEEYSNKLRSYKPEFLEGALIVHSWEDITLYCGYKNISRKHFNIPVIIADDVKSCIYMFRDCEAFNQSVVIPTGVTDCIGMFRGCKNFNQSIVIPEGVIDCTDMFMGCIKFNQSIKLPKTLVRCKGMFEDCIGFKQDVIVYDCLEELVDKSGLHISHIVPGFDISKHKNRSIFHHWVYEYRESESESPIVGDKETVIIRSRADIIEWCKNHSIAIEDFNQPVTIPEGVISCKDMFYNCKHFNQLVTIPSTVKNCNGMFAGCVRFNQPVEIPIGVETCVCMFYNCKQFDQPIVIPNTVKDCSYMFYGCEEFYYNLDVPKEVETFFWIVEGCSVGTIYFYGKHPTCTYVGCGAHHIRSDIDSADDGDDYDDVVNRLFLDITNLFN